VDQRLFTAHRNIAITLIMPGHISHRMKKRYSHTRIEVKRAAIEALKKIAPDRHGERSA